MSCGTDTSETTSGGCDTCTVLGEIRDLLKNTLTTLGGEGSEESYKSSRGAKGFGTPPKIVNNEDKQVSKYAKEYYDKMLRLYVQSTKKTDQNFKQGLLQGGDSAKLMRAFSDPKASKETLKDMTKRYKSSGGDVSYAVDNATSRKYLSGLITSASKSTKKSFDKYLTGKTSQGAANFANTFTKFGANTGKIADKANSLDFGHKNKRTGEFISALSKSSPEVQNAFMSGKFDTQLKAIAQNTKDSSGYLQFFAKEGARMQGRQVMMGIGGASLGAAGAEMLNFASLNMNSPAQSKLEYNKRKQSSMGTVGGIVGGAVGGIAGAVAGGMATGAALGGGIFSLPGMVVGGAVGALGYAGGSYAGGKLGKETVTKDTIYSAYGNLSTDQKRNLLDSYGNTPEGAINTMQQMASFSKNAGGMASLLTGKGRELGDTNQFGLAGAGDAQIGKVLENVVTLSRTGRLNDVKGLGQFAKDSNISSEYLNNLTSLMSKAPSIVSGKSSMLDEVKSLYDSGTSSGMGMVGVAAQYKNLGFSSKVSTDAIVQGLLGTTMDDITKGNISKEELSKRVEATGMPMSLLKEQFPLVFDAVSESGGGDEMVNLTTSVLDTLKSIDTKLVDSSKDPKMSMSGGISGITAPLWGTW